MCGLRLAGVQYNACCSTMRAVHLAMVTEVMPPEQPSVIMILKARSVTQLLLALCNEHDTF